MTDNSSDAQKLWGYFAGDEWGAFSDGGFLVKQSPNDAGPVVWTDYLFGATSSGASLSANQTLGAVTQDATLASIASLQASQILGDISQVATIATSLATVNLAADQTLAAVQQAASLQAVAGISATQTLGVVAQTANISVLPLVSNISANQLMGSITQVAELQVVSEPQRANKGDDADRPRRIVYIHRLKKKLEAEIEKPAPPKKERKRRAVEIREVIRPVAEIAPVQFDTANIDAALDRFARSELGFNSMIAELRAFLAAIEAQEARKKRNRSIAIAMLMAA